MAAIATLTMNPALDLATETERVRPTDKLRCAAPRYDPGGGGINVARVACRLGAQAVAVFPSGGPAGALLEELLADECVDARPVAIAGRTRESFVVSERESGDQYRFVMPGPELSEDEQERCLAALGALSPAPAIVAMSGSLPPGVAPGYAARVARLCRRIGARLVLDTSGPALAAAAGEGVFLLKPNLRELEELAGRAIASEDDELAAARSLVEGRAAEAVVLSLGERGALLVTAEAAERVASPRVTVASAVGAGDSMVAGIACGLVAGLPLARAVRLGTAAGAAALITAGTGLARRDDVERLWREMSGDPLPRREGAP